MLDGLLVKGRAPAGKTLRTTIINSNFIFVSYWSAFASKFSMSGSRDIISAEYRELFDGTVQKKMIGR